MAKRTLDLLELLLVDRQISVEQLNALVADRVPEDQFLDYKDRRELVDAKKAGRTLRQYMSGFANSDGGVLIIGVNDQNWKVTGCSAPGGGDLAEWASSCVMPIASLFSQRPEFCVVDHPHGSVLVAWTARSLSLVHCNEGGEWAYYLRFHDKTLRAPDYLISDLVLGRRQHPSLRIFDCRLAHIGWGTSRTQPHESLLSFPPRFDLENESLYWAEEVAIGVISWAQGKFPPLSNQLLSNIEVEQPTITDYAGGCSISHVRTEGGPTIAPFAVLRFEGQWMCSIPLGGDLHRHMPFTWEAAVYVMARGSRPIWYQLRLKARPGLLGYAKEHHHLPLESDYLEIEHLPGGRPRAAWFGVAA